MAPKRILVVLTSHDKLGSTGNPTGWYLPEFAHPYNVFSEAGYEQVIVSPKGGVAPLDPNSVQMYQDKESQDFYQTKKSVWENTEKLENFLGKEKEFDAIFYPGGHGPVFDLAIDSNSQKLITNFWEAGKVVSAVCHGPAVFANVDLPSGPLVSGKAVTAFTNSEESAVGLTEVVPFLTETVFRNKGAKFEAAENWAEKVVVDGNLYTGQNPASAKALAEEIVKKLGK